MDRGAATTNRATIRLNPKPLLDPNLASAHDDLGGVHRVPLRRVTRLGRRPEPARGGHRAARPRLRQPVRHHRQPVGARRRPRPRLDRFHQFAEQLAAGSPWSGGERRLLALAASLGADGGLLNDNLPGLDRHNLALMRAAVTHAGGSHKHTPVSFDDAGNPYRRPGPGASQAAVPVAAGEDLNRPNSAQLDIRTITGLL